MKRADLMSIGEFARRSRLSPKALRLYDDLGLLPPARVDESSGSRFYLVDQLEQARLIASLRQLRLPLSEIRAVLSLEPALAADRLAAHWTQLEAEHSARRRLASFLINRLLGKGSVMYEVSTRRVPARSVLCLKRHVDGEAGAWAFGKEFMALLRESRLPALDGTAGAAFCIWWGEVSDDGDGPLEWCRPIPSDQAETLATELPQLSLRTEPAHDEAYVDLGSWDATGPAQWQLISGTLQAWAEEHAILPSDLGARITYVFAPPATGASGPDCDFAIPFVQRK